MYEFRKVFLLYTLSTMAQESKLLCYLTDSRWEEEFPTFLKESMTNKYLFSFRKFSIMNYPFQKYSFLAAYVLGQNIIL